jgi:hypothetical protein
MKNKTILIIAVLILVAGAGYWYSQKAKEPPQDPITTLNKGEDKTTQEKQYISITYPNGPTFEYRSDVQFKDQYDQYKMFTFGGGAGGYAFVSMMENYSQSLVAKAGNGEASDNGGSVEYRGTRTFGNNTFTEYLDCGLDTCEVIFVLERPNDRAFIIGGDIDLINPASVVFN